MFCPFCKAEYRAGITKCSDCSVSLVEEIPKNESDSSFMVLLWNGDSLSFLEAVCAELDRAAIPVATPRLEVLLRDPADRYHLKHLKTFPYVLGVFKRDFAAARRILQNVAAKCVPPIYIAPVGAYPEPVDRFATTSRWGKSKASLDTTMTICASEDLRYIEFLEASLQGLDIPFRRVVRERGLHEIQVRPEDEERGRRIVDEISKGISTEAAAAAIEDTLLRDEPPKSYFLAWFLPSLYWFAFCALYLANPDRKEDAGIKAIAALLIGLQALSTVGSFWMFYQALRYEVRPFRYCVMALVPLTCVWYYVERYSLRTGEQRLPIMTRIRLRTPPS